MSIICKGDFQELFKNLLKYLYQKEGCIPILRIPIKNFLRRQLRTKSSSRLSLAPLQSDFRLGYGMEIALVAFVDKLSANKDMLQYH